MFAGRNEPLAEWVGKGFVLSSEGENAAHTGGIGNKQGIVVCVVIGCAFCQAGEDLGISVSDVSESYQIYGLPAGAAVQAVVTDGPAEKAGLQAGDIITKADDTPITCGNDLVVLVGKCEIGQMLELTVYRRGETITITVTIDEQIQSAIKEENTQQNNQGNYPWGSGGRP